MSALEQDAADVPAPVLYDQEFAVGDGSGRMGDCLRAAVATLLQVPPVLVPNFAESSDWLAAVLAFRDGLHWFSLQKDYWPADMETTHPWVIGIGRSPRGIGHAVVLSTAGGSLVHDPHPSRAGLCEHPTAIIKTWPWCSAARWAAPDTAVKEKQP